MCLLRLQKIGDSGAKCGREVKRYIRVEYNTEIQQKNLTRSLKVIATDTQIHRLRLTFCSVLVTTVTVGLSCTSSEINVKIANFSHPRVFNAPDKGFSLKFCNGGVGAECWKLEWCPYQEIKKSLTTCLDTCHDMIHSTGMDRRTDRQTEGIAKPYRALHALHVDAR